VPRCKNQYQTKVKAKPALTVTALPNYKKTVQRGAEMPKQPFNDSLPEIIPAKNDRAFKKVLADNEHLLAHLMKSVLDLPEEEYEGLAVACSEILPDHGKGKLGTLDIKVHTKSKIVVDIEIERGSVANLPGRILFYVSALFKEQMLSGSEYESMRRVIGMIITERALIPGDTEYHHRFTLYDLKTRTMLTDLIEVNTLELSKLPEADDGSDLWGWLKFLTITRRCDLEKVAERGPAFKEAAEKLSEYSMDTEERRILERRLMMEMEERWTINDAEKKGMEKERIKNAKSMVAKGIDVNTIAEVTGLTIDEVLRLK